MIQWRLAPRVPLFVVAAVAVNVACMGFVCAIFPFVCYVDAVEWHRKRKRFR